MSVVSNKFIYVLFSLRPGVGWGHRLDELFDLLYGRKTHFSYFRLLF